MGCFFVTTTFEGGVDEEATHQRALGCVSRLRLRSADLRPLLMTSSHSKVHRRHGRARVAGGRG